MTAVEQPTHQPPSDRRGLSRVSDLSAGARVGIGVVALAAAVLSFASLRDLATTSGTSPWIAWLLPVALDAAAGVSTVVWLRAERTEVVRLARRLAWCTIALSVVGNGVQHAYAAAGGRPHWLVAVAVGAVAPGVFGAVVHLAVTASARPAPGPSGGGRSGWAAARPMRPAHMPAQPTVAAQPSPVVSEPAQPAPEPLSPPAGEWADATPVEPETPLVAAAEPAPVKPDDTELVARLAAWSSDEGGVPGRDRVRTAYGVGPKRADRLRDVVRAQRGAPITNGTHV